MKKNVGVIVALFCIVSLAHAFGATAAKSGLKRRAVQFATSPFSQTAEGGKLFKSQPDLLSSSSSSSSRTLSSNNVKDNSSSSSTTTVENNKKKNVFAKASVAGLAVSLAMIPEAVAFSFVAGVNPLVGLWTTVFLGFTAATFGGRAGIMSSASGACSVVVAALCASHGPHYLAACAIVAGVMQMAGGLMGLGKLFRLVPHPVMLGFVNGLAVVMTKAQLIHFRSGGQFLSPLTSTGGSVYGVAALTMALVKLLPKLTKAVPPSLGAVTLATLFARALKLPVKTLADVAGASTFRGGLSVLPRLGLPKVPLTWSTLQTVFPYALTMGAVGVIESLLTMQLVDDLMDDGKKGSTKQECIGQGLGNIMAGFTGGIGGCALLGQSIINVQSGGGISKWSGMSMAIFLACGIVAAAPLLGSVPVASLVGVMLLVCQSTFNWSSLRLWNKIPRLDAFVIALVSIVTVQHDLAVAVLAGTVASALGFAWNQSTGLTASTTTVENNKSKVYQLNGPLFFGSTSQFMSLFPVKSDPDQVILDFSNSKVMDHSALEAINNLAEQYDNVGKKVTLRHLSKDCTEMLERMNNNSGGDADDATQQQQQAQPSASPKYEIEMTTEMASRSRVLGLK